ncbi:hypothetical protein [Saccharibacillus qingshengii]|uniref:hypothetical protein n=1 Tax=Saccharibacillus qingshengii TaxID=1763540 RepID=UPI0015550F45|nr:hypothetical protein [Saccharibacillus qingshengii]
MTRDQDAERIDKGPGPDGIPEADPHYEDTDPGSFDKITEDNLTGERSIIDDPEDSEELDK